MIFFKGGLLAVWLSVLSSVQAVSLNLNDSASLDNAASLVAVGLMDYYTGNQYGQTIGMFSNPYYGGKQEVHGDVCWITGTICKMTRTTI